MTMINIGGDVVDSGGGLSANALALSADTKLLFQMEGAVPNGLLTVGRRMRITKLAAVAGAMVAGNTLPAAEVTGNLKVLRGNTTVAQLDFSIPPSGQIPSVNPTVTTVVDAGSSIVKDATKGWQFAASRVDANGSTPVIDTVAAAHRVWLGEGKSVYSYWFNLEIDPVSANNNLTAPNRTVQLVGYDQTNDKEMAPQQLVLNPAFGPFGGGDISSNVNVGTGGSGNLPVGTVVLVQPVLQFPDGRMVTAGSQKSVTATESGGVSVSCPYLATAYIAGQADSLGPNGYMNGHSVIRYCTYGVLYKLSTHSGWTYMQGTNQFVNINNAFPDGGISLPPATVTFTGVRGMNVYGKINPRPTVANWDLQIRYKLFALKSGTWYQVSGPGTTEVDLSKPQWPYAASNSSGPDGNLTDGFSIDISTAYSASPDTELRYAARDPRGDQFYVAGEKTAINLSVPSRFGATNLRLYAKQGTADANGNLSNFTAWRLIYDGPYVATFKWLGAIVNNAPTIPNTNTTATYASFAGQVGWPVADPTEIVIEPGDQVIATRTAGSVAVIQLAMPVEFLD